MTKLVEFEVAREHQGDKITDEGTVVHRFEKGDTRLADPAIVKTLVDIGVLVAPDAKAEPEAEEKADEPVENKAEPAPDSKPAPAPQTKPEPAPATKPAPKPSNKAAAGTKSKSA